MKLTKGFKNLHAGKAQTLTITKVVYDEKFDKMRVHFKDEEGGTGIEQLMFVSKDDKPNEVALNIFSTIALKVSTTAPSVTYSAVPLI